MKNTETNLQALAKMVKKMLLPDNNNLAHQELAHQELVDLNLLLIAPDGKVLKMICETLLLWALELMARGNTSLLLLLADILLKNHNMRSSKKEES